jgi:hypothetical protein
MTCKDFLDAPENAIREGIKNMKYDANKKIDGKAWLSEDENERIESVIQFHRGKKVKLPNINLHGVFHVMVENQIAEGIPVVQKKLDELLSDGLDRHDAVHAIGSVLSEHIYNLMKTKTPGPDVNEKYYKKLSKLTARNWLKQYST